MICFDGVLTCYYEKLEKNYDYLGNQEKINLALKSLNNRITYTEERKK